MDIDEYESQAENFRNTFRRSSDAQAHADLSVLSSKVKALQHQVMGDEDRIQDLEGELSELKAQLSGAKGVFWGIALILSGIGVLFADRVKELLIK